MDEPLKMVYILGSGHCGSTLLDMLLNGHSGILGLGELDALTRFATGRIALTGVRHGANPPAISFWEEVKRGYENRTGSEFDQIQVDLPDWRTLRRWQHHEIQRWAFPQKELLSCVQEVSGASILTDASKTPRRVHLMRRSGLFDLRIIHLVRDGLPWSTRTRASTMILGRP